VAFNVLAGPSAAVMVLLNFLLGIVIEAFVEVKVGRCRFTVSKPMKAPMVSRAVQLDSITTYVERAYSYGFST